MPESSGTFNAGENVLSELHNAHPKGSSQRGRKTERPRTTVHCANSGLGSESRCKTSAGGGDDTCRSCWAFADWLTIWRASYKVQWLVPQSPTGVGHTQVLCLSERVIDGSNPLRPLHA
ncbi:hypothetical protein CLAIMM_08975 isoform 2, partial [Cladophialophora immunda]